MTDATGGLSKDILRASEIVLLWARREKNKHDHYEGLDLSNRLRSAAAMLETHVIVPRELSVPVMVQVCGSEHPEDYQQVAEGWRDCLNALAASQGASNG